MQLIYEYHDGNRAGKEGGSKEKISVPDHTYISGVHMKFDYTSLQGVKFNFSGILHK
jgi:hypothetical protein